MPSRCERFQNYACGQAIPKRHSSWQNEQPRRLKLPLHRGLLAIAERANGNKVGAKAALDHVLEDEPENVAALLERADLFKDEKNFDLAITDLRAAAKLKPYDKGVMWRCLMHFKQAGKTDEALAVSEVRRS